MMLPLRRPQPADPTRRWRIRRVDTETDSGLLELRPHQRAARDAYPAVCRCSTQWRPFIVIRAFPSRFLQHSAIRRRVRLFCIHQFRMCLPNVNAIGTGILTFWCSWRVPEGGDGSASGLSSLVRVVSWRARGSPRSASMPSSQYSYLIEQSASSSYAYYKVANLTSPLNEPLVPAAFNAEHAFHITPCATR
jgi:hypothetical protein